MYRMSTKKKKWLCNVIFSRKGICKDIKDNVSTSGMGRPAVWHALVVIFLEFFAWGLLTTPMIMVLNETFPDHTFLMNGLIQGVKGFLSFLSAPLVGALSDVWGRKSFLLVTVFFTCMPIPLMKLSPWWCFALISISGVFSVTFSVVFAYVADITKDAERSQAYGLVSATFAASLVTSPAIGEWLGTAYSDNFVVWCASAVAILDLFFIMVAVPESLPDKLRGSPSAAYGNKAFLWEHADPFSSLRAMGADRVVMMICMVVFLSYLPEAGQYSCLFVYLKLVMGFTSEAVVSFIGVVGILSVVAQTIVLAIMIKSVGNKHTIIVGLIFQMMQLAWYGFGSQHWMMWAAGCLAAMSSVTYPAISSYVSRHTDDDKQGLMQGMVTGIRGLCMGVGPAMYGFTFYLFHVNLNPLSKTPAIEAVGPVLAGPGQGAVAAAPPLVGVTHPAPGGPVAALRFHNLTLEGMSAGVLHSLSMSERILPGPPFVFGAVLVMLALLVATLLPEDTLQHHLGQQYDLLVH